jgi:4-amino-4-deoxy-L-arabinose transferase-like glycosyltransferase
VAVVALASRLRYVAGFDGAYGSGDAHLVLTKALFVSRGDLRPDASLGLSGNIFATPPLIPLLLGSFARLTSIPVESAPLILGPLVTVAGLLALYAVATRAFDRTAALIGVLLVALLPRFSFDSTEPDKVAYVLSFFLLALLCLYEGQRRPRLLLAAGAFMGLSVFAHTTGYLFLPVYVLSHVALSRGGLRRTLSPYFLASGAIVLAFLAAYVALDQQYAPSSGTMHASAALDAAPAVAAPGEGPPPTAQAPSEGGGGLLPDVVRDYFAYMVRLTRGGFRESAGDLYLDGIRSQLLDPVYVLAIGGFGVAAAVAFARRRVEVVPLLLWMMVVTAGFAVQYPAASHTSRYPSYVTPVFVLMAVFFAAWAARQIVRLLGAPRALALALMAPFVAYAAFSYISAPDPGLRKLYAGHRALAAYVTGNRLLGEDAQILYLGWPSYTFGFARDDGATPWLHTFGWQRLSLAGYNADFVERNRIRYYAYDDLTDDYYGSARRVFANLERDFELTPVFDYCTAGVAGAGLGDDRCAGHVTLYEIGARKAAPAGTLIP